MSRKKRGSAADVYYNTHLYGGSFANNPVNNRVAAIENMHLNVLSELAANRFKWFDMPETVDVRFLDLTLLFHAVSIFYNDEKFGFLSLKGGGTGYLNMMDNPTSYLVVGNNFVGKTLSAKDCVPIWGNYLRTPHDINIIRIYANRMAELDRTIEINSLNARQSKVLIMSENQKLSIENINRQIDEGQNVIQISGAIQDMEFVQAVDLGVNPDSFEKLHILKVRQWTEALGLLGIDGANQDKKERLVSAEVDANNDQTLMMRYVNLQARQEAADKINAKFGLNIRVEYNTDVDKRAQKIMDSILEEKNPNG